MHVSKRLRPQRVAAALTAFGLSVGGLVVFSGVASAHDNAVKGVAACQVDGAYTVTWTITNDFNVSEKVNITGHKPAGSTLSATNVTIGPKGATTVTQTAIAGTSTSASIDTHGAWKDGVTKDVTGTVKLKGDCAPPPPPPPSTVTPVAPSASAMTCVGTTPANGSITVTPVAGVVYTLAGHTLSGDTFVDLPAGSYTVVASPASKAYALAGAARDGTVSFTLTVPSVTCAPPPPPPSTVTPVAPSASAMTCVGTTPANGSITVTPVAGVVYTLAGHTLSGDTFADLPAGSYTVVASPASNLYALAGAARDGTVSFTVAVARATCATTSPTVAVSGSLSSTCPAVEGQLGSYTLTLANAASSAEAVLFRISENGTVVATSAAVASGAGYSYAGSLSAGSAVTIKADYSADAGATWASVVIANPASIVCPSVLGQEFVDQPNPPAATLPYTGVPVLPMLAIGFGLVIVGALLVRSARVARVSGC